MREERISSCRCLNEQIPSQSVLVIVPTYNERENISALLRALTSEQGVDVFVVDDGSPDGTADEVEMFAREASRRVYLMRRTGKFGLGVAYLDAYRWVLDHLSSPRIIVQMDADFSHDPAMLALLVPHATAYGVVIGSRYVSGGATPDWNWRRFLLSLAGNVYMKWVLRIFYPSYTIQDSTSGFVAWRRDVLERVLSHQILGDGYAFQASMKLMAFRLNYPAIEIPIVFRDRRLGVSKLNRRIIFEAWAMPWRLGTKTTSMSHSSSPTRHDNSLEMWDRYYASESKDRSWFFAKVIHWAREVYFGKLFARRVIELGGPAARYLELGVGSGQTIAVLQRLTGSVCVGLEKTPRAFELGKAYATNCEMVLGDALQLPFQNGSFEVVYSLGLFEHFEPHEQLMLLREQARVATKAILIEVPARTPHMRCIMWFNRRVRGRMGVWADDELFSPKQFRKKYPGLPFRFFFDWWSGGMTCWFVLQPEEVKRYVA